MAEAGGRARSRPTSRCSRSRPTRSTPRCRAPASGVVTQILVQEGETVEVGTTIARIGGSERRRPPRSRRRRPRRAPAAAPAARAAPLPAEPPAAAARRPTAEPPSGNGEGVRLAGRGADRLRARRRPGARSHGTGRGGRVTKKDILAFVESGARRGSGARSSARARGAGPGRAAAVGGRAGARTQAPAALAGRADRADDGDAARDRRAHAPLARHRRARDERDRGRPVAASSRSASG